MELTMARDGRVFAVSARCWKLARYSVMARSSSAWVAPFSRRKRRIFSAVIERGFPLAGLVADRQRGHAHGFIACPRETLAGEGPAGVDGSSW